MTYVGDFPPCSHRFVNSNGMIICQQCGASPKPVRSFAERLQAARSI